MISGIDGYLCKNCHYYIEKTTEIFEAEYVEGSSKLQSPIKGKIVLLLYDNANNLLFLSENTKIVYFDLNLDDIQACDIEIREEISHVKEIFRIGKSKSKEKNILN